MKPITQIYAERVNFQRLIQVHMRIETNPGQFALANPVSFHTAEDGEIGNPMLSLSPDQAQQMVDALWEAGLRPTQGKQSEGQVAATERHLEDMRAITFAQLRVNKP